MKIFAAVILYVRSYGHRIIPRDRGRLVDNIYTARMLYVQKVNWSVQATCRHYWQKIVKAVSVEAISHAMQTNTASKILILSDL